MALLDHKGITKEMELPSLTHPLKKKDKKKEKKCTC